MVDIERANKFFDWWVNVVHGNPISNESFELVMERFKTKIKWKRRTHIGEQ